MRRTCLAARWLGVGSSSWLCCRCSSFARAAHANGRYPLANQLVARPGRSHHLVARTTFGLLRSDDAGATWTWVCEDALGMLDVAEDPSLALTGDGTTVVAVLAGDQRQPRRLHLDARRRDPRRPLRRRRHREPGAPARRARDRIVDRQQRRQRRRLHPAPGRQRRRRRDLGRTSAHPLPGFLGATVEVAASTADRIYISGKVLATESADAGALRRWRPDVHARARSGRRLRCRRLHRRRRSGRSRRRLPAHLADRDRARARDRAPATAARHSPIWSPSPATSRVRAVARRRDAGGGRRRQRALRRPDRAAGADAASRRRPPRSPSPAP